MISAQQAIEQERTLQNQLYEIDKNALARQLQLESQSTKNPVRLAQINAQLEALEDKHNQAISKLDAKAAKEQMQYWQQGFNGIQSSFSTAINSMLSHTQTFGSAMQTMMKGVADSITKAIADWTAKFIIGLAEQEFASKLFHAKQINQDASEAAAGAYKAVVGIPYVGPFLAPGAAAVAYAAVDAFASGGFDIPSGVNPVTQLHSKEMVLPAPLADRVRSMTSDSGGSGGDIHVHNHFSSIDARGMESLIKRIGPKLMDSAAAQARNFYQPKK